MIRFDHITKKYPGTTRPALNSIDVEILRGEFVFLVGASGSGKSSCLRLVLKEEKPTSGSIHVLGHDLRSISNRKVPYFRRNLGVVFQDFRLLPNKTVFDNVAFSLQVIGKSRGFIQEAVPDTLKMVGLAEKAQRLPHELSGGEQQRVAIARAIVNKPQILLADEPTGNLDPTTSAEIMALLASINAGGTTVIMATHEAGIVDKMQRRVIELVNGTIVRDERQGGYATASIPVITGAPAAAASPAEAVEVPLEHAPPTPAFRPPARTIVSESDPNQPLTFPPAPVPAPVSATAPADSKSAVPAALAPESVAAPRSAPVSDSGMPPARSPYAPPAPEPEAESDADTGPTMTRPVIPVTQHDAPEQLTLAEKLGLRAPGEKPDQTGEQNVGPTR
ncbi:ABC transporter ATP-binding protein [Cryobacterium roopkundense]|uniref:Cell division ATP-binding protein FtsE n=1 Tax=Cryobacterium roopkundense TaxID=1001240 RepID=A0A099J0A2_9MICO|nr:cell division ATP-binding protein FtsE [Cryobacterium roopkundense]KGJ71656.1 ABC transporter ATP-binding protein [Cryobacterium roopkundense]MBB5641764.1 cell division transport system ATP-binding protein [Cryobacterium roopkundense]